MPYKKKYKKKRRSYRKKKSNSWLKSKGTGLVQSMPFPKTFKFKTRYVHTGMTLNPGLGGLAAHQVYSANGLYDPDITGVGHQPLGFDQIMPMYDHYTVIGSRIKVTAANMDLNSPQYVILSISDAATAGTDQSQVLENGVNRFAQLGILGSGDSTKTLTLNCNTSKFLGQKVMQSTDCKGDIGNNPAEQCYFIVTAYPALGNDSLSVRCIVEIEYIAIMTEPHRLSPS